MFLPPFRFSPFVALLLLAPAATLAAQAPGYQGPDARQLRAEFRAQVIGEINEALDIWSTAWTADDVDGLMDMYTDQAVVFPPAGEAIQGPEAVREWLEATLPAQGRAEAFLQDFEAAGNMAAVQTNYRIEVPDAPSGEASGTLFTVFLQQGRSWRIRSQVFRETVPDRRPFPEPRAR